MEELKPQNQRQLSSHSQRRGGGGLPRADFFPEGLLVEVRTKEEGFTRVYFTATVLPPKKGGSKQKSDKIFVEYHNLLAREDGSERLKEYVDVSFVRPVPPFQEIVEGFEPNDAVDAFFKDGWWMGAVTRVVKKGESFIVTFEDPPDELELRFEQLRVHWDWGNGSWIRPGNQVITGSMFDVGNKVEVSFDKAEYQDVWFPATIRKDFGNGHYSVECIINSDEKAQLCKVKFDHIRPLPPLLKDIKFLLLEKVDAHFGHGWWCGITTRVLVENSRYMIYFRKKKILKEFNSVELRPHVEWKDGKWFTASKEVTARSSSSDEQMHASRASQQDSQNNKSVKKTLRDSVSPISVDISAALNAVGDQLTDNPSWGNRIRRKQRNAGATPNNVDEKNKINSASSNTMNKCSTLKPDIPNKDVGEVTKPIVENDKKEETKHAVVIGLPCSETGSTGNEKSTVKKQKPNGSPIQEIKDNEPLENGDSSDKKKRGRPRRGLIANLEIEKGGTTSLPLKRGRRGLTDSPSALGGGEATEVNPNTVEVEKVVRKSLNDGFDDKPLSKWIKELQPPSAVEYSELVPVSNGKKQSDAIVIEDDVEMIPESALVAAESQVLPFVKNTVLWTTIESMEAFQKAPQRPHFKPLEQVKESSREGLAIGYMVTFCGVVERALGLRFDSPKSATDDILETIVDLEMHGFDVKVVRDRVNWLLSVKDNEEKLEVESKKLNDEIAEHDREKSKIGEEINEIKEEISKLQDKLSRAVSATEKEDCEIALLRARIKENEESISKGRREFEDAVSSKLRKD
ncbi:hypothetical protein ABFS83_05G053500 [Erythranthe nasuta]